MIRQNRVLTGLVFLLTAIIAAVTAQICQSSPLTLEATEELQTLTSPNYPLAYPPSQFCKWVIDSGDADYLILIDITSYIIESSSGCTYDGLFVYDGQETRLLIAACGTASHTSINLYKSSGRSTTIQFRSDATIQLQGFTLRYFRYPNSISAVCQTVMALNATIAVQYIYSPGFPELTDLSEECTWLITALSPDDSVMLEVLYSDMIPVETCEKDTLLIYDGTNDTAPELTQVCSNKVNFVSVTVISSAENMFLKFTKQHSLTARTGFVLSYSSTYRGRTVLPTTTVPAVPALSVCSTDRVTAAFTRQHITSPNYPDRYDKFLRCYLVIQADSPHHIYLNLLDFAVQSSLGCRNDGLAIYDGPSASAARLGLFCGEDQKASLRSTGSSLTLFFYSSSSNRGFKLEYSSAPNDFPECIDPSVNITFLKATSTIQYFTSPNYPHDQLYNRNQNMYWIIYSVSRRNLIELNVTDSEIGTSNDCVLHRVTVYKGPCASYEQLGTFCGTQEPRYKYRDYILVIFKSNGSDVVKGFNMSYQIDLPDAPETGAAAGIDEVTSMLGVVIGLISALVSVVAAIIAVCVAYYKCQYWKSKKEKKQAKINTREKRQDLDIMYVGYHTSKEITPKRKKEIQALPKEHKSKPKRKNKNI
ncbi:cubilin-like [Argopecten irradians]|uniref:cubilin-like n=1 Tax=Argopecten irradians TaxID=31199 RepID=UPI003715B27A